MDTTKIEAFLEVVRRGSVTDAARELGYTASGVSRMIEALETRLGFALFVRSRHGMELTHEGRRMLPALREIGRWQGQAEQLASEIRGVVSGKVAVASYFSLASAWLPAVLSEFGRRYPHVSVDVVEGDNAELAEELAEHRVDVGLVSRRDAVASGSDFRLLYTDQMVVWLPQDHELCARSAISPRELTGVPFVMPLPGTNNDVEGCLAANGVQVDVRFSSRDPGTLFGMVEAGLGLSMNNALMSRRLRGHVEQRPLDPPYTLELGIATSSLGRASPAARCFVDVACEVVADLCDASD